MKVVFSKYQGCGNDFILIDNRSKFFPYEKCIISQLCHRHMGIGADGIILLESSDKADFLMRILNADGSEAEMCGNGFRCFGKYLQELGIFQEIYRIEVYGKILTLKIQNNEVIAGMSKPWDINCSQKIVLEDEDLLVTSINTGVPHVVLFVSDIEKIDILKLGKRLRFHKEFSPNGTNVNFAQVAENYVIMRTYERGVEAETLACGTGATAVAIAAHKNLAMSCPIQIKARSGEMLKINFKSTNEEISEVTMSGPANFVYQGWIEI